MMTETWLEKLERDVSRKTKVRRTLRKEIDEKIQQLRVLDKGIEDIVSKSLSVQKNPTREDVEWDLMDERLNGGK
jgi:hypothetical protein|tara:strand:+ start:1126 stop:1350 length:225 start_codon:yes stop_codon:yes gene_type:complete